MDSFGKSLADYSPAQPDSSHNFVDSEILSEERTPTVFKEEVKFFLFYLKIVVFQVVLKRFFKDLKKVQTLKYFESCMRQEILYLPNIFLCNKIMSLDSIFINYRICNKGIRRNSVHYLHFFFLSRHSLSLLVYSHGPNSASLRQMSRVSTQCAF